MRRYTVTFTPEARDQLAALYRYIANSAAARYTEGIVTYCEGLQTFPNRGTQRDDIRPGLRITHYRKRSVIAFVVDTDRVSILGVYYGGQDYEAEPPRLSWRPFGLSQAALARPSCCR